MELKPASGVVPTDQLDDICLPRCFEVNDNV